MYVYIHTCIYIYKYTHVMYMKRHVLNYAISEHVENAGIILNHYNDEDEDDEDVDDIDIAGMTDIVEDKIYVFINACIYIYTCIYMYNLFSIYVMILFSTYSIMRYLNTLRMQECICICIYIYVYIYMNNTYTYLFMHIYTGIHTHIYVHPHIYMYVYRCALRRCHPGSTCSEIVRTDRTCGETDRLSNRTSAQHIRPI
jgi:hypothetical protein